MPENDERGRLRSGTRKGAGATNVPREVSTTPPMKSSGGRHHPKFSAEGEAQELVFARAFVETPPMKSSEGRHYRQF